MLEAVFVSEIDGMQPVVEPHCFSCVLDLVLFDVVHVECNQIRERDFIVLAELIGATCCSAYLLEKHMVAPGDAVVELGRHERREWTTLLVIFELEARA